MTTKRPESGSLLDKVWLNSFLKSLKWLEIILMTSWHHALRKTRKYMSKLGNFLKRISLIRIPQVLPVSTHCSSSFNSFFKYFVENKLQWITVTFIYHLKKKKLCMERKLTFLHNYYRIGIFWHIFCFRITDLYLLHRRT